jgi:hypothetical protein
MTDGCGAAAADLRAVAATDGFQQRRSSRCQARHQADTRTLHGVSTEHAHASAYAVGTAGTAGTSDAGGDGGSEVVRHKRRQSASSSKVCALPMLASVAQHMCHQPAGYPACCSLTEPIFVSFHQEWGDGCEADGEHDEDGTYQVGLKLCMLLTVPGVA